MYLSAKYRICYEYRAGLPRYIYRHILCEWRNRQNGVTGDATEDKEWPLNSWIDDNVRPGDNFYKYALGRWINDPNGIGVWHKDHRKEQMTQLFNMFTLESNSTINVDGKTTLEENMADFGGLTIAYDAFVSKKIKEGFSGLNLIEQKKMFFQSFASLLSDTDTDEVWEERIKEDFHSPAPFRVNGNVCLMDDWYDLYDVQAGDKYYLEPSQRIVLW